MLLCIGALNVDMAAKLRMPQVEYLRRQVRRASPENRSNHIQPPSTLHRPNSRPRRIVFSNHEAEIILAGLWARWLMEILTGFHNDPSVISAAAAASRRMTFYVLSQTIFVDVNYRLNTTAYDLPD